MAPKIGITTQIVQQSKWYKHLASLGFDTIEINRQDSRLVFNHYFLEKVARYTEGYDLSIHSGTRGIFQSSRNFTQAELAVLIAEVDLCSILGAGQLVFHLNDGTLTSENRDRLREVVEYAGERGIRMMYESNSLIAASEACAVLEGFPELGYVLDLGHLSYSVGNKTLGCDIEEFVKDVRSRVEYVHASNNRGTCDENSSLSDGVLDWRRVLDLLDLSQVMKIIIEVRSKEMVESTRNDLVRYLKTEAAQKG